MRGVCPTRFWYKIGDVLILFDSELFKDSKSCLQKINTKELLHLIQKKMLSVVDDTIGMDWSNGSISACIRNCCQHPQRERATIFQVYHTEKQNAPPCPATERNNKAPIPHPRSDFAHNTIPTEIQHHLLWTAGQLAPHLTCLLYTSDAADD